MTNRYLNSPQTDEFLLIFLNGVVTVKEIRYLFSFLHFTLCSAGAMPEGLDFYLREKPFETKTQMLILESDDIQFGRLITKKKKKWHRIRRNVDIQLD